MPKRPDNGRGRGTDTPASNLQQPTPAPTRTTTALSLPDGSHDKAIGPLRQLLEETAAAEGLPMKALTVLANQNDPFRVDTPAGHRDGAWLAEIVQDLLGDRRIHLRGLHYAITMHTSPIIKPNGERYLNDDPTWEWLQNGPAKDARWLGYLPFDQITDERNAAPVTRIWSKQDPCRTWTWRSTSTSPTWTS